MIPALPHLLSMRHVILAAVLAAFAASASAQDKITLNNGDVLTGTIKTMEEGVVTIVSPVLGDVAVPFASIRDLSTGGPVDLQTKTGDRLVKRRILGIEAGTLRVEGDTPPIPLDNLGMINPPLRIPPEWTGALMLNALWTDGNTDRRSVGMTFDAQLRREEDRLTFDAYWNYSEDKENDPLSTTYREWELNDRRAGGGLKYDYFLSKRLYAFATGRAQGDTLADIDLRIAIGAGLGYMWVDNKRTTFLTEVGLAYVDEDYRSNIPSVDYLAARVYYKLTHAFTEATKFMHSVEAYPSLEDPDDVYLTAKAEVGTTVTGNLVASLGWVGDYDNTPAPDRERLDNRVMLSIGWQF